MPRLQPAQAPAGSGDALLAGSAAIGGFGDELQLRSAQEAKEEALRQRLETERQRIGAQHRVVDLKEEQFAIEQADAELLQRAALSGLDQDGLQQGEIGGLDPAMREILGGMKTAEGVNSFLELHRDNEEIDRVNQARQAPLDFARLLYDQGLIPDAAGEPPGNGLKKVLDQLEIRLKTEDPEDLTKELAEGQQSARGSSFDTNKAESTSNFIKGLLTNNGDLLQSEARDALGKLLVESQFPDKNTNQDELRMKAIIASTPDMDSYVQALEEDAALQAREELQAELDRVRGLPAEGMADLVDQEQMGQATVGAAMGNLDSFLRQNGGLGGGLEGDPGSDVGSKGAEKKPIKRRGLPKKAMFEKFIGGGGVDGLPNVQAEQDAMIAFAKSQGYTITHEQIDEMFPTEEPGLVDKLLEALKNKGGNAATQRGLKDRRGKKL